MTIALIIAITNALAALAAYATGHQIWCGFNITMTIVFTLSAMVCEGKPSIASRNSKRKLNI